MRPKLLFLTFMFLGLTPLCGQPKAKVEMRVDGAGYLGTQIRDIAASDLEKLGLSRESGVYVERVEEDSPAAEAGLQEGDVIVEYAGAPVMSVRQLRRLISETPVGRRVDLAVVRQGETLRKTARIGERASADPRPLVRIPAPRIELPRFSDFDFQWSPGGTGGVFIFADRPRLGITAGDLTDQMADFLGVPGKKGVLVMGVAQDSPAEKAGLQAGDVILSMDGDSVSSAQELSRRVKEGSHELEIVRNKQPQKVTVTVPPKSKEGSQTIRL